MIDLFGMGRQEGQDPEQPQHPAPAGPSAPEGDAPPPKGSHRLWAFLLVLDSIFVIVFGGAVAAKVYQYWKTPAAVSAVPVRRHPAAKAPEVPKAPEPAAAAAPAPAPKAAEPAKAEPEPKAEVKTARRAETPRPPKPSMIVDAPKPHAAPSPVAAAPSGPVKALPVVFKVHAPKAGSVQLVGAFIVHGGRKEMSKDGAGNWTVKLYLNPGQYRYFFAVDKRKTLDPENPRSDRGASLLTVP